MTIDFEKWPKGWKWAGLYHQMHYAMDRIWWQSENSVKKATQEIAFKSDLARRRIEAVL